jgi:hypothetical protein
MFILFPPFNGILRLQEISKGFQVVELTMSKNLFKDVYTVTCKGVEPAKILEWKGPDAPVK